VGSLKGVVLSLNPEAQLVDLSHEVGPQDIRAGAFLPAEAAAYFPPGTIHLAVVDPGVGSSSRALAARCRGHYSVGPDNGLFHLIFNRAPDLAMVSLENPAYFRPRLSATFHGRDIFAPVAAHLSLGVDLDDLGPRVTDPVFLALPELEFGPEAIQGEIISVDRFGNLISNIPAG
jgi:S-adenosyl-L-methionine hydrolase (adenosine-forming)